MNLHTLRSNSGGGGELRRWYPSSASIAGPRAALTLIFRRLLTSSSNKRGAMIPAHEKSFTWTKQKYGRIAEHWCSQIQLHRSQPDPIDPAGQLARGCPVIGARGDCGLKNKGNEPGEHDLPAVIYKHATNVIATSLELILECWRR